MRSLDQGFVLYRHTNVAAFVAGDGFHLINGRFRLRRIGFFLKGDVHDRAAVFIVVFNFIHIDEIFSGIDINRGITPEDLVHTVNGLDFIFVLLCFVQAYIL